MKSEDWKATLVVMRESTDDDWENIPSAMESIEKKNIKLIPFQPD